MKNKKKIVVAVVSVVLILGIIAGSLALRHHKDKYDTEDFYRQNVASTNYENTIETAYPTTDVYGIIKSHFEAELPAG